MNIRKAPFPKIGMKFGFLTVISSKETKKNNLYFWKCKCKCGTILTVWNHNLLNGNTKACRCVTRKHLKEKCFKHGMSHTKFWNVWCEIRRRCYNKNTRSYKDYGGRGINVCEKWLKFENFYKDMYKDYEKHIKQFGKKNTSIERINNEGNYKKNNCKWATQLEQANNKRNNLLITYNKKTMSLSQWANSLKIKSSTLRYFIVDKKLSIEQVIVNFPIL